MAGSDDAARDLDETRRLIYIANACGRVPAGKEELAGTLINALAHHQKRDTLDLVRVFVYQALNHYADSSGLCFIKDVAAEITADLEALRQPEAAWHAVRPFRDPLGRYPTYQWYAPDDARGVGPVGEDA